MSQLEKPHILIVDDSQTIRNSLSRYIGDDYIVLHASNGEEAWALIKSNSSISLIFADLHMPVMNGMALLNRIRSTKHNRVKNMPVIMITGHADTEAAKRASYNMGASDFISKPFSELDIVSRVNSYVKLSQKIAELEQNSPQDDLTGLLNRLGFHQSGEQALAAAIRHKYDLSVLSMQMTNVDEILKKYGKKITSQIMVSVANTMQKSLRKEETLAHLGMGKFSMLFPLTKVFRAQIVAQRFQKTISNLVFKVGSEDIRLNLALGLNSTEHYSEDVKFTDMAMHAELAMQESLKNNSLKLVVYDQDLRKSFSDEFTESADLDMGRHSGSLTGDNQIISSCTEPDNFKFINSAVFSRYMSMILNGDFNKIPKQDIKILLQPLQSFIEFVEEQKFAKEVN